MSVILVENPIWSQNGKPIVNGKVYIGEPGSSDPPNDLKEIFADEALKLSLANPQTTGADGRAENKIYTDGKYSIQVNNSNSELVYLDDNAGEVTTATGPIELDNVEGINDLIAEGAAATITGYVDQQEYALKIVSSNTGAMSVNIDGVGITSLTDSSGAEMTEGKFTSSQNIRFIYNETLDRMSLSTGGNPEILLSPLDTNGFSINESEGEAVASATTPDIWAQDGNTLHITGTDPITTFTEAPRIGAKVTLIFDEAGVVITHGSGITLQGAADITTEAGDIFEVYADAVTAFSGTYIRKDGFPLKSGGYQSMQIFNASGTWTKPDNVNRVIVICTGGGGAGNVRGGADGGGGGGGGAGGTGISTIINPDASESVVVGAAGIAPGGAGGTSSWGGSIVSASAGGGGGVGGDGNNGGVGGSAGTTITADISLGGGSGSGGGGNSSGATSGPGGSAGNGMWGGGGGGTQGGSGAAAGNGEAPGAGGGGGGDTGGSGHAGIVIVLEFY